MEIEAAEAALIKQTYAHVRTASRTAAALFYGRLFTDYPDLRLLFKGDIESQHIKFIAMLESLVESLDDAQAVAALAEQLGRTHQDYQVRTEHYALVGEAMLWSLGQILAESFTSEVERAWTKFYVLLSDRMRRSLPP